MAIDRVYAQELAGESPVWTNPSPLELADQLAAETVEKIDAGKFEVVKSDRPACDLDEWLEKAGGPYIGPRGGKWADPQRTIPWDPERHGSRRKPEQQRLFGQPPRQLDLLGREKGKPDDTQGEEAAQSVDHYYAEPGGGESFHVGDRVGPLHDHKHYFVEEIKRGPGTGKEIDYQVVLDEARSVGGKYQPTGDKTTAVLRGGDWFIEGKPAIRGHMVWRKPKPEPKPQQTSEEKPAESRGRTGLPDYQYKKLSKKDFRKEMDRRRKEGLAVSGNTYAVKDEIKRLGGVWDRYEREWLMPDKKSAEAVRGLLRSGQSAGTGPQASADKPASTKQVNYAMSLIRRLEEDDYGTFTTFGFQGTTKASLRKLSSADISAMIDGLRDELY